MSLEEVKKNWFKWTTIGGDSYEGEVIDIDSNIAIVKCTDGEERAVEI